MLEPAEFSFFLQSDTFYIWTVKSTATSRTLRFAFACKTNCVRSSADDAAARLANTTDRVQTTLHRLLEHTHKRHCFYYGLTILYFGYLI